MSLQTANDKWLPDGLGAVLSGRPAQGELEGHQLNWYINCLELMAVFIALQYFRLSCRSTGGKHSSSLLHKSPGRSAFMQSKQKSEADFSLGPGIRAVYIPWHLNVVVDLYSIPGPTCGSFMFGP